MSKNFVLDKKNVRTEILQADYMKNFINGEAQKMADSDSRIKLFIGFDRAKAIIYPNKKENKDDRSRYN